MDLEQLCVFRSVRAANQRGGGAFRFPGNGRESITVAFDWQNRIRTFKTVEINKTQTSLDSLSIALIPLTCSTSKIVI